VISRMRIHERMAFNVLTSAATVCSLIIVVLHMSLSTMQKHQCLLPLQCCVTCGCQQCLHGDFMSAAIISLQLSSC